MRVIAGGRRIALLLCFAAVPVALVWLPLGAGLLLAGGAVAWFYRDPDRTPPATGILSPADGRVTVVREEAGRLRVGVFMNVTDVHVNRAPACGNVERVAHEPGGHWPAFSKASERNERLQVDLGDVEVTLIAGAVARRIRPYVKAGDTVASGDRIGHIALGSRADVLLPAWVGREELRVTEGDRVRAGETVVAERP